MVSVHHDDDVIVASIACFLKAAQLLSSCWARKQWRARTFNLIKFQWMLQVLPASPLWVRACRCLEIGLNVLREFADRLEIVSVWDRRAPLAVKESLCVGGREVLAVPTCGKWNAQVLSRD